MHIQRKLKSTSLYEYGCDLRRLLPWKGVVEPSWGCCMASVRPGESTTPHSHDELEIFLVISGSGYMSIEDEKALLREGDVVLIEKKKTHCFSNASATEPLVFLSIFWDSPQARQRLREVLEQGRADA